MLHSYFFNFFMSLKCHQDQDRGQWWVISFRVTLVQNNLRRHYTPLFLFWLPLCIHLRNRSWRKECVPCSVREVGAIDDVICLRRFRWPQERKRKWPLPQREAILHWDILPWHSATRGGMDQGEVNCASCLDGFPELSSPSFGAVETASAAFCQARWFYWRVSRGISETPLKLTWRLNDDVSEPVSQALFASFLIHYWFLSKYRYGLSEKEISLSRLAIQHKVCTSHKNVFLTQ